MKRLVSGKSVKRKGQKTVLWIKNRSKSLANSQCLKLRIAAKSGGVTLLRALETKGKELILKCCKCGRNHSLNGRQRSPLRLTKSGRRFVAFTDDRCPISGARDSWSPRGSTGLHQLSG